MAATIDRTLQLADSGALRVPEGQPIPVEKFSEAVYLAEAPEHGGKPLLAFESPPTQIRSNINDSQSRGTSEAPFFKIACSGLSLFRQQWSRP